MEVDTELVAFVSEYYTVKEFGVNLTSLSHLTPFIHTNIIQKLAKISYFVGTVLRCIIYDFNKFSCGPNGIPVAIATPTSVLPVPILS